MERGLATATLSEDLHGEERTWGGGGERSAIKVTLSKRGRGNFLSVMRKKKESRKKKGKGEKKEGTPVPWKEDTKPNGPNEKRG